MTPRISPIKSQTTIELPCLVDSDNVNRAKCVDEVVRVVLPGVFDA